MYELPSVAKTLNYGLESNSRQGVCVRLFCVSVVLCAGSWH
jgi:hypothetical protein